MSYTIEFPNEYKDCMQKLIEEFDTYNGKQGELLETIKETK